MRIDDKKAYLARRPDSFSALIAFAHLGITYAPVYLAAIAGPSPLLFVYWLWFGLMNNGVINLLHECAHKLTFARGWANDALGGYVLAPLVLTDFESYRRRHWEHHRHLGGDRDGKLVYRTSFRGRAVFGILGRSLVGVEAIRRLTERPKDASGEAEAKRAGLSLRLIGAQSAFLASVALVSFRTHDDWRIALLSAALAYGFVYAYGLGSLTVFAAALRAIAEHKRSQSDVLSEGEAALRNLRCNAFTRLLMGAYGFGEHATHHMEPAVPYYRLLPLTEAMAQHDPRLAMGPGYIATLIRLSRE